MDKHTPGPWRYEAGRDGRPPYVIRGTEGGFLVVGMTANRQEADARLIAAAPDLLQACQTFAEWLRREDVGFAVLGHDRSTPEGESAWREWYDGNLTLCALAQKQACAAIAKATGEATC